MNLILASILGATMALAGASPLTAQNPAGTMPDLDGATWFNVPPLKSEDLRDRAILVEVFRTTEASCLDQLPFLNAAWEEGKAGGLVVISVTDESKELVDAWIRNHDVTHPVIVMADGSLEKVIGVKSFPTAAVFHHRELKFSGKPVEAGPILAEVRKLARADSVYPKKLSKIVKSMNKGEQVKALNDLYKVMEKLDGADAAWASRLERFLLDEGAAAFQASAAAIEAGFWYRGQMIAEPYLEKDSAYMRVMETRAQMAMLSDLPHYSDEISGGEMYVKAKALERETKYLKAVKLYQKVLKKCEGTKIAVHAHKAAQELIERGQVGYKSSCDDCIEGKDVACEKHHKKIKL